MNVKAISPVPFANAPALLRLEQPQAQSHLQEDTPIAKPRTSPEVSSSGSTAVAVQAFTAFPPNVQPIATLVPANDTPQALPVDLGSNPGGSPVPWSGVNVDVYA
jgi:hypothetical protein